MNNTNFYAIESTFGNLDMRQDLTDHAVTIYLKDWDSWDMDTKEVEINEMLIHFVETSGDVVGIKVFGDRYVEDDFYMWVNGIPVIKIESLDNDPNSQNLVIPSDYVEDFSDDEILETVLRYIGIEEDYTIDRNGGGPFVWVNFHREYQ